MNNGRDPETSAKSNLDDQSVDPEVERYMMMHLLAWRIANRSRRGCRMKLLY